MKLSLQRINQDIQTGNIAIAPTTNAGTFKKNSKDLPCKIFSGGQPHTEESLKGPKCMFITIRSEQWWIKKFQ